MEENFKKMINDAEKFADEDAKPKGKIEEVTNEKTQDIKTRNPGGWN